MTRPSAEFGSRMPPKRRVAQPPDSWHFLAPVVKNPYAHPDSPILDNVLTFIITLWTIMIIVSVRSDPLRWVELLEYTVVFVAFVAGCKALFVRLGRYIITAKNLKQARNLRKFGDQSWQLVIHIFMTIAEIYLLGRESVNWEWYENPTSLESGGMWDNRVDQAADDPELRSFYLAQLVVWTVTAVCHRFYDARHKDYFVMYSHHVATVVLIGGSYLLGSLRIGLLVLFLHDASDIFVDLLKMTNYAGLDADAGYYLTELVFVLQLATWAYARLYTYPIKGVMATWQSVGPFSHTTLQHFGLLLMGSFLTFLVVLHIWWYFLFLRILYRLLTAESAHDAGREEYEGSSNSEADNDDDGEGKETNKSK
eukprot:m.22362 g.22362  ORF g.22362 m.22362 type:complete len:367 (+) comp3976_c0_seq2:2-1102(+)